MRVHRLDRACLWCYHRRQPRGVIRGISAQSGAHIKSIDLYIFGAILTAFGLPLTILGVVLWQRGLSSLAWPQTTGVVRTSILTEAIHTGEVSVPATPNVKYEYEVGRIKYSSNRIAYGYTREASEYIEKYRVGLNVPVYYNPDKPKMSVLEPARSNTAIGLTIFGLILFSIGIALMVLGAMFS